MIEMPWAENLQRILLEAQNLQQLYVTLFRHVGPNNAWSTLFQTAKWPRLTVLDLGDGDMDFPTLQAIL